MKPTKKLLAEVREAKWDLSQIMLVDRLVTRIAELESEWDELNKRWNKLNKRVEAAWDAKDKETERADQAVAERDSLRKELKTADSYISTLLDGIE